MRKVYETPELDVTKFEVIKEILLTDPTGPGYTLTNKWTQSGPDETVPDLDW